MQSVEGNDLTMASELLDTAIPEARSRAILTVKSSHWFKLDFCYLQTKQQQ